MKINLKTYNSKNKAQQLDKEISKSNFIKLILITIGSLLTLVWLSLIVASLIELGTVKEYGNVVYTYEQYITFNNTNNYDFIKEDNGFREIKKAYDMNIFYEIIGSETIPILFLIFAPIGYIGIIVLIALRFGVLKPNSVRSINRKALSLGYLKQKDFDYVNDAIDYNIGIKEITYEEEKE